MRYGAMLSMQPWLFRFRYWLPKGLAYVKEYTVMQIKLGNELITPSWDLRYFGYSDTIMS